jgi:uncharacterized protein
MLPQEISTRARRIACFFLLGVIVVEGIPLVLGFAGTVRRFIASAHAPPLAWALALASAALFIWLTVSRHPFIRAHLFTFSLLKALAIPMAFVSGIFEEFFFRAFLMNLAQRDGWSSLGQVLFSAVSFGLAHGVWGLFGRSLRVAVGAAVATGLLGAALAYVYLVGGRSVAPCAFAHVLINLVIEPWLILSAAANKWGGSESAAN